MVHFPVLLSFFLFFAQALQAQTTADPVALAIERGDLYQSKHKYDLALLAYQTADKLAHHQSAACILKMAIMEEKLGDFSSALDDTKKAIKAAGNDKTTAIEAHMVRAALLVGMSNKPADKKLKEAEGDTREAIALEPDLALAHFNLGTILLKQGRDPEGVAELNRALGMPGLHGAEAAEAKRFIASPVRAREPFAPDFHFVTKENLAYNNASLRGKVVLLDFWATWCPPCRESVPTIKSLSKRYAGKGLVLVGISSDDDEDVWRAFISSARMDWQEYLDSSDEVNAAFRIESIPTYIVIDKDGLIRYRQSGFGNQIESELDEAISKALKRESNPELAKAAAVESAAPAEGSRPSLGGVPDRSGETRNPDARKGDVEKDSAGEMEDRPLGIEAGNVSGSTYKNAALDLTYEFPGGWIAAKSEKLHKLNLQAEASAKASLAQHRPDLANTTMLLPKYLFYASKKGEGDATQLSMPCMRISAAPTRLDSIALDRFQKMAEALASASSGKLLQPASEFVVKDHPFVRADVDRMAGGLHVYQSYVQTLAGDYLLTIEIYSTSVEELRKAAQTLESMVIRDDQ
jgi:thiol-disulfide isomerase/thioredoxin